ncbi:nitrite reductase (NADH) small subunit [Marininema mesophilum]|uniref:Nitrite reductase (NADH) small subunit n=1 Tax=Marininema mesophilum TaxID=1048340 RepID=A0A1H2S006_9BACL|nr:nitrite reductase small subunit NirD [Marininema mesophilum]SDW25003.1 nitrite reductase (NADH) small subunit [Marininema mesophilum]
MEAITIGKIADFPKQMGRVVHVAGMELAVFRLSTDQFRILENRCPHRGGPLAEGIVSGKYVFCPLHEWKISTLDGNVQEPDEGCVQVFQAKVEGENVQIMLDKTTPMTQ